MIAIDRCPRRQDIEKKQKKRSGEEHCYCGEDSWYSHPHYRVPVSPQFNSFLYPDPLPSLLAPSAQNKRLKLSRELLLLSQFYPTFSHSLINPQIYPLSSFHYFILFLSSPTPALTWTLCYFTIISLLLIIIINPYFILSLPPRPLLP